MLVRTHREHLVQCHNRASLAARKRQRATVAEGGNRELFCAHLRGAMPLTATDFWAMAAISLLLVKCFS